MARVALLAWLYCGCADAGAEQPLPFSHETHALRRKMPCVDCHAGAQTESWAGMPTVDDCLRCHAFELGENAAARAVRERAPTLPPDPWVRLYGLLPHAHVSHAAHAAAKVPCEKCHGATGSSKVARREQMLRGEALMDWCIECHVEKKASTDCVTCHR